MHDRPTTAPISIAIANDFEIIVAGLRAMLDPYRHHVRVVDESTSGVPPELDAPVDVLLFDTFGRPGLGLDELRAIVDRPMVSRTVIYSWEARPQQVRLALDAGVDGWLTKAVTGRALVDAIDRIHGGERVVATGASAHAEAAPWPGRDAGLTPRESEVLSMLLTGVRNKEIADSLFVSPETVKFHLANVYRKLGVRTRAEAIATMSGNAGFRRRPPAPERGTAHQGPAG